MLGCVRGGDAVTQKHLFSVLSRRDRVIGRRVLPVRVCTCPKRDMKGEEETDKQNISTIQAGTSPSRGKVKVEGGEGQEEDEREFWVLVSCAVKQHLLKQEKTLYLFTRPEEGRTSRLSKEWEIFWRRPGW